MINHQYVKLVVEDGKVVEHGKLPWIVSDLSLTGMSDVEAINAITPWGFKIHSIQQSQVVPTASVAGKIVSRANQPMIRLVQEIWLFREVIVPDI